MKHNINQIMEILYYAKNGYKEYIDTLFTINEELLKYYLDNYSELYLELETVVRQMKSLAQKQRYEKMQKMAEKYADIAIVQKEYLKMLIKNKRITEALEICQRKEFQDNPNIQYYHVQILNNQDKDEEALEILLNPQFKNRSLIQSLLINFLRKDIENNPENKEKDLQEAQEIFNQPIFYKDVHVNLAYIDLMMFLQNYLEIIRIASLDYFKSSGLIQAKKIIALQKLGKEKEAYQIMINPKFKKDYWVQLQYFKYLLKIGNVKEAQDLATKFPLNRHLEIQKPVNKASYNSDIFYLDPILEAIKNDEIKEEDLMNKDFAPLYLLAYYDKERYPESIILQELKKVLALVYDDEKALKNGKQLKNYLLRKNHLFEVSIYQKVLDSLTYNKTR